MLEAHAVYEAGHWSVSAAEPLRRDGKVVKP